MIQHPRLRPGRRYSSCDAFVYRRELCTGRTARSGLTRYGKANGLFNYIVHLCLQRGVRALRGFDRF
jgi:hypothetical protein